MEKESGTHNNNTDGWIYPVGGAYLSRDGDLLGLLAWVRCHVGGLGVHGWCRGGHVHGGNSSWGVGGGGGLKILVR